MKTLSSALLGAALIGLPALADETHPVVQTAAASGQAETLSEGEIRRIDKEARKLTIRHGPLANLDMPAMTMVFQVRDPAMLEQLKPGDKVRFQAQKLEGVYTITRIEPAR